MKMRAPAISQAIIALVLRDIRVGELLVEMPDGATHRFAGSAPGPAALLKVNDVRFVRRLLSGGQIALAEGYMDGSWDTPDLEALLDLALENLDEGWAAKVPVPLRPVHRAWHAVHDNNPWGGSKRNIAAHYDLGNDFYESWLDDSMTYSAACLDGGPEPLTPDGLEDAQRRKWDRVLEMVQPQSGGHILEIGCGWGGFAIHAAEQAGCKVTGLTLSQAQAELARERVARAGLEGRVDIRLQDYREIEGSFDGIASIEMFEAVGEKWWPVFFERVRDLLRPGAAAGLQVITVADDRFEEYRRNPDFIQRYIFPGGMLPSFERFSAVAREVGVNVTDVRFFGHDYYQTLRVWAERFEAALPRVRALGFDERFVRMWRFYLTCCQAVFNHGAVDVMQVRLES